jgi:hypothetical protein
MGEKMNSLHRTLAVPSFWLRLLKARLEMIAPAFPDAAEIPCAVALNLVGNTSAGYMYVVLWGKISVRGKLENYMYAQNTPVCTEVEEKLKECKAHTESCGAQL